MGEDDWEENPFENRPATKKDDKEGKKDRPITAEKEPSATTRELPPPPEPAGAVVPDEENPFETRTEIASVPEGDEENPFENRPGDASVGYQADEELLEYDEFDRSKLSFLSGGGFVALGIIFYLFVYLPGDSLLMTLSVASIILSTLVAFFYLLDDLKIRTTKLTERGARFISGIFFMILIVLLFIPLMAAWPNLRDIDIPIPLTLIPIIVLTHASVALFLYSMLWEE